MLAARTLLLLALLLVFPLAPSASLAGQEGCILNPAFQQLRDQLPDIVGECLAPEALNPATGNVAQPTTGGLLVRRPVDGLTGFTDGRTLWPLGPDGLASRVGEPGPDEGDTDELA
jgi:hypothetical protein